MIIPSKAHKMRKQTLKDFTVNAGQFKGGSKILATTKNPRYIYTEEDLGEGILDASVNNYYAEDFGDKLKTSKPWVSLLRTQCA